MSRELYKMNLISVVQKLPSEDIETIQGYVEMIESENRELKKQLEEKQNPLKGIFAQVNDDTLLRDCGNMNAEINELKNQQKEFVKWLEDWYQISKKQHNELNEPVRKNFLQVQMDTITEILSKYKEIIGDVEDENK